jgi:ABC-type polysaccharide/polyol phosphate export permease
MPLPNGVSDVFRTFSNPQLILYMAWSDIRARYKRSVLGPLWITLGTAIGVVGLGFIWSALFKMNRSEFIPLLTIGLILWQFLSNCIMESASVFNRQANIIRNLDLPMALHPAQLVLRHLINLAHNLPLFFVVTFILGNSLNAYSLLAIPNLLLVICNLYWMSLLIGILGARFRDFEYMVVMIMPLLMFLSPVMYRPKALPFGKEYMWLNPLADMIEIIRYPMLGEVTPMATYFYNIGLLLIGGTLTMLLFNTKCRRIAFWI